MKQIIKYMFCLAVLSSAGAYASEIHPYRESPRDMVNSLCGLMGDSGDRMSDMDTLLGA